MTLKLKQIRFLFKLCYVCLLLLVVNSCSNEPPPLKKLAPNSVVLSFGDSLTFGTGADADKSYPSQLAKLTGLKVINAGKPGEVSADGAKRLPRLLEIHQPQLLILCHGGNDLLRKYPQASTAANLTSMINHARSQGIPVILLGVPKPKLFSLKSAEFYQQLAQEYRLPLEANVIAETLGDSKLKSDAIHPNAKGYAHIAKAVYKLLISTQAL